MGRKGSDNLKPARTTERARELGRAGGIASGAARRRRKGLAELATAMLEAPAQGKARDKVAALFPGLDPDELTMGAVAVAGQVSAAAGGSTRAFQALAEMQERGAGVLALHGRLRPAARAALPGAAPRPGCRARRRRLAAGRARLHQVERGQPGAGAHAGGGPGGPRAGGHGARRGPARRRLRAGRVAIEELGVQGHWRLRPGTKRIVNTATGQLILFRGLNDPRKTKSIKVPFGRIKVMWLEECDQLEGGMADIRTVRQSVTRGGEGFVRIYTFNPPRTRACWVNREVERVRESPQPGERVYDSCYTQVPREWLGEQFVADAEALKAADEESYRHEYLGEAVGYGGTVFPRARVEEVPDSVRKNLERHWYGVDWGFAADPWVWVKVGYDRKSRTLYVLDEMHGLGLPNVEAAERTMRRMQEPRKDAAGREVEPAEPYAEIQCDSAEPKSVDERRGQGLRAVMAPKQGVHSVRSSVKWLQDRAAIVIDPKCELAAAEFPAYEYERSPDGEVTGRLPDRDNHAIDAVRYACATLVADRGIV